MKKQYCNQCLLELLQTDFTFDKRGNGCFFKKCKKCCQNNNRLKTALKHSLLPKIKNLKNEIWKDIPGYEGLYKVSSFGRIKSLARKTGKNLHSYPEKLMSPVITVLGYTKITLSNNGKIKHTSVHRIVAITFIPNPENKKTVNHKDGNKQNNCVKNLEWATYVEQMYHADNTGLRKVRGELSPHSKLKTEDVLFIRSSDWTLVSLAKHFNVNVSCIEKVKYRTSWKHI